MSFSSAFVQVEGTAEGIGKLVGIFDDAAEVEYFDSPAGPALRRIQAPVKRLKPIVLAAQTRVFWYDEVRRTWMAGRVDGGLVSARALNASEDHYHVRFPNKTDARVPISELYVRSSQPIQNPADYLAYRITDTPFFFEGRVKIVRHIAQQRAAFGGLTGLASSAVDLIEHQVLAIRRVLSDPIQRYLLADEVGLGKTIEAGALIRQHLIDLAPHASVALIVPDHLVGQWQNELAYKFFLGDDAAVRILPSASLLEPQETLLAPTLLVVDEAHNICLDAFSEDPKRRHRYEHLALLAAKAPAALLLSGTPVLHQEEGFLAMLHLLEPDAYPLDELESFRQRVEERKTVAEAIADLRDDASSLFAEEAIDRIESTFPNDARLHRLCSKAREHLSKVIDDPDRTQSLRTLRTHVSEIYRLHRRLLRSRRVDPKVQEHLPTRNGVHTLEVEDHLRAEAYSFLDAWRLRVLDVDAVGPEVKRLFAAFVEAAISHPRVLLRRIEQRLACLEGLSDRELGHAVFGKLDIPWVFEQERELLHQQRELLKDAGPDPRIPVLATWLREQPDIRKVIVFVDDSEIADMVAAELGAEFGSNSALRYRDRHKDVRTFEQSSAVRVLVCDSGAEEGLNLQRTGAAIVHYDLPLEPARIEQRIGRVDRIELRGRLRNVIFSDTHPYESEWRRFLVEQIGVFNRSIASLQYVLSEAAKQVRAGFLSEGREAIEIVALGFSQPGRSLEDELRRINAEEALDSVEVNADEDAEFFNGLLERDERLSSRGRISLDSWVKERLQFFSEDLGQDVMRYLYDLRRPTLVPLQEALESFNECIDRHSLRPHARTQVPLKPLCFDRARAELTRTPLLRVGHAFLTHLETLVRKDDRGTAFALWRYIPRRFDIPEVYFRFDFFIEANLIDDQQLYAAGNLSKHALRRRADDAFPVSYHTIWLSADLEVVKIPETLAALALSYSKLPRADGSRDWNLSPERWELAERFVVIQDWTELVERVEKAARQHLVDDAEFRSACADAAKRMQESSEAKIEALESRLARLSGKAVEVETRALTLERTLIHHLVDGITTPNVRMDSTGVVILASRALEET